MLEWVWHNVPGGVLGLCVGVAITSLICRFVLLRTMMDLNHRHKIRLEKLKAEYDSGIADARQAYVDILNEIDERVERRVRDWWPDPNDMDAAWKLAEQMAEKRKRMDAGRKTDVRNDGPPSKIHKLSLKKGK